MINKIFWTICLTVLSLSSVYCQTDATPTPKKKEVKKIGKPTRAALYSAALPGLGQYYNKTAWQIKVPIIYTGATVFAYLILDNHAQYRGFRDAYIAENDLNPLTSKDAAYDAFGNDGLLRNRDKRKRDRDYYIILSGVWYLLNIAEAATTAHLNEFDIKDNISLKVEPMFEQGFRQEFLAGVSLKFRIH